MDIIFKKLLSYMTQLASTMVSVICSSLLIIAAAFMLAKMIDHYLLGVNDMDFKRLALVTKVIYIHMVPSRFIVDLVCYICVSCLNESKLQDLIT